MIDLAIVGAGAAGISAARAARERGLACMILEASDRVGGRACTVEWQGHALDLGATDRVEQGRDGVGHEQVLAAVDGEDRVAACAEPAEPGELRRRPLAEAGALGRVRLLVAGLEQARQRAVGRAGQEPAVEQERLGLVQRAKRAVRRQAALEGAPLPKLLQAHRRILTALLPWVAVARVGVAWLRGKCERQA